MAKKNYEDMDVEELEAVVIAMNNDLAERRQEILRAHAVLDAKNTEASALRKLGNLNENEMAALVQHIGAEGIPSRDEAEEES